MTVYADALFLVNASMDLLTVAAVCAVTHRKARRGRLICAAVLGALLATVTVLLPDPGPLFRTVAGILTSAAMAAVGFGIRGVRELLRDAAMIWGAGALLGGIMTALFSLGTPVFARGGGSFPLAYLICAVLSFLWSRLRRPMGSARQVKIRIEAAGERAEFVGLCDTGSSAADPIGGLPAILVKRRAAPGLARLLEKTLSGEVRLRLRMIPVKGVGGDRLLPGFLPDRVFVEERECAAAVAVDGEGERYGEADALVPGTLCR